MGCVGCPQEHRGILIRNYVIPADSDTDKYFRGGVDTDRMQLSPPEIAFDREDRSFSMLRANVYVMLMILPITAAFYLPYWLIWEDFSVDWNVLVLAALLLGGILLHEILHGVTWMIAGGTARDAVKFGFQLKTLTPYAHCTEPLEIRAYRWGAAMPGLVLGIVPALVGLALGNLILVTFGFLFTLAAGGDALILWVLRDVPAGSQVEDHPTRAGCYVITQAPNP